MKTTIMYSFLFSFLMGICNAQDHSLAMYKNKQIEQSENYIKGNKYQKDFLLFIDMLQKVHPAFNNNKEYPINLDSIAQTSYNLLSTYNSLSKYQLLLQSILVKLNDGHTFVTFPTQNNSDLYLLNVLCDNKRFYIVAVDKMNSIILGDEIESINNIPISKIITDFSNMISFGNQLELEHKVNRYLMLPHFWQNLPYVNTDSTLYIKCKNEKIEILKPKKGSNSDIAFLEKANPKYVHTQRGNSPFSFQIVDSICYFQFNSCIDYNTVKYQWKLQKKKVTKDAEKEFAQYSKFDVFLETMFTEIQIKNIKTLVVDVRYNRGGNSILCNQLLTYLHPYNKLNQMDGYVRISEFMKQQYPIQYKGYKTALQKANTDLLFGNLYNLHSLSSNNNDNEKDFFINKDSTKLFKGQTIFIQGNDTYSSAGILLTLARDNKIGLIIGEKSTYQPCHYGDILDWKLPNTETSGGMSFKYFERPDKTKCNESWITPDIFLHTSLDDKIKGNDPCWEWIIKNKNR